MEENNLYGYKYNAFKGKVMGIFTSGGDSPGMNAAVRTCVRAALYYGIKIFIIKEGYQGMINGDDNFIDGNWMFVSNIIHLGGTIIGSARCTEFQTRPGRLKAAYNLVIRNITHLIVIGGDGSLTGANIFREEWVSLLEELLEKGKINTEQKQGNEELFIVGLVGSIDNDFCRTDMTIGTDSALHRIMDAYEAIHSTAHSHQRAFVLEVMGRKCGYLALCTALATEADYLFIPESPPNVEWRDKLCDKITQTLESGQRLKLIIVAEGAIDCECTPITSEEIKDVLVARLNLDVRVTVLGHVQRGGNPSAFDRILASRMGFEAVVALAEALPGSESIVISIDRNILCRLSLVESVRLTKAVAEAISAKDFHTALKLRGHSYRKNLEIFRLLTRINPPKIDSNSITGEAITGYRLAVMHIGSPSSGMNAAVRSFTRNCLYRGHRVFAIHDGIKGLLVGNIQEMGWYTVSDWVGKGGALIGANRLQPEDKFKQIAERFKEFNIQGLLIIGGFDAYTSCGQLFEERSKYPEFCIPMIVLPTTINNNVPGAEFTIGSDTALNIITEICDRLRQSAQGTRQRVFIIETMGDYCGYLATLAGLASAADATYIFEEKFTIRDLANDVENMKLKIESGISNGLVLRTEKASENYSTDFIHRVYAEEGKNIFTCKMSVIGHMQQGGYTTPFDRNLGTKLGAKCIDWFVDQLKRNTKSDGTINCTDNESACVLGSILREHKFTPLAQLLSQTDFKHRMPKEQWWLKIRPMLKILTLHESPIEK